MIAVVPPSIEDTIFAIVLGKALINRAYPLNVDYKSKSGSNQHYSDKIKDWKKNRINLCESAKNKLFNSSVV